MAGDTERGALFRPIGPNQHGRVTCGELFFDLVFVFAVTQISHTLLGRFTPSGALQTTVLFLAVWWVWVLLLSILTSAIMIVVAAWESISLRSDAAESWSEEARSEATSA